MGDAGLSPNWATTFTERSWAIHTLLVRCTSQSCCENKGEGVNLDQGPRGITMHGTTANVSNCSYFVLVVEPVPSETLVPHEVIPTGHCSLSSLGEKWGIHVTNFNNNRVHFLSRTLPSPCQMYKGTDTNKWTFRLQFIDSTAPAGISAPEAPTLSPVVRCRHILLSSYKWCLDEICKFLQAFGLVRLSLTRKNSRQILLFKCEVIFLWLFYHHQMPIGLPFTKVKWGELYLVHRCDSSIPSSLNRQEGRRVGPTSSCHNVPKTLCWPQGWKEGFPHIWGME